MRPQYEKKSKSICPAATTVVAFLCMLVLTVTATKLIHAQNFRVIHSFTGATDGFYPTTGLTPDAAGNLYGAASSIWSEQSCPVNCLEVYQLSPNGSGWNFATLFFGQDASQGSNAFGGMVFGPDGSLYGTTMYGGTGDCNVGYQGYGCGIVFKLTSANGGWAESVVYQFSGVPKGGSPAGELAFDRDGNLYGTTGDGGSTEGCQDFCTGNGVVYKLTLSNGAPTETDLYDFGTTRVNDGIGPDGGVIFDSAGDLYGTTVIGGEFGGGTVFELMPNEGHWSEQILHNFHDGDDGVRPFAGLTMDPAGNLYGGTANDYLCCDGAAGGGGTAFALSRSGSNWSYEVLYDFASVGCGREGCPGGGGPLSNLVMDSAGNLYGATYADGQYGRGSVFKLSRTENGWTYISLHEFTGGSDGAYPWGSLVVDSAGNLYGTTTIGGIGTLCPGFESVGCGVVFEITP